MNPRNLALVLLAAAPMMLGAAPCPTDEVIHQASLTSRPVRVTARRVGDQVVVRATGEHSTTGYTVRLNVTNAAADVPALRLVVIGPPPGSFVGMAITPFVARARVDDPDQSVQRVRVRINGQAVVVPVQ